MESSQGIGSIADSVTEVLASLGHYSKNTSRQLHEIDARVEDLQRRVMHSIRHQERSNRGARQVSKRIKGPRRISARATKMELFGGRNQKQEQANVDQVMRVINPAILYFQDKGRLRQKVIAVVEDQTTEMGLDAKKKMLQQLMQLRLLLWLFEKNDNQVNLITLKRQVPTDSCIVRQGGINFQWYLHITVHFFTLGAHSHSDIDNLLYTLLLQLGQEEDWVHFVLLRFFNDFYGEKHRLYSGPLCSLLKEE